MSLYQLYKLVATATSLAFIGLHATTAYGEYILNPQHRLQIGIGGYARVYSGKLESYQYNNVLKAQPELTAKYLVSDTLTLRAKYAYRIVRDDRFVSKNLSRIYDFYGTIDSKIYGKIDIGKLLNVAYLMHQGSVDVSCLDVDDSDISYFYQKPKGFYAPTLTYLSTDSRDPKITYTTPDFGGFQAGLTLVEKEDKESDSIAPNNVKFDHGKGAIGGMRYLHHFNEETWLGLSGGLAFYKDNRFFLADNTVDTNHREYSLGSKLGWKGWRFGASYRRMLFSDKVALKDSSAVSLGIAHHFEKYAVSLTWLHSQAKYDEKDKYNHIMLSNKYTFNSYLEGYLSLGQLDFISNINGEQKSLFGIMGIQIKI